jgi:hypothetical protein
VKAPSKFLRGVILSAAKDLLFACAENKADPSVTQNRRDFRMTLLRVFPQPLKACPFKDSVYSNCGSALVRAPLRRMRAATLYGIVAELLPASAQGLIELNQ